MRENLFAITAVLFLYILLNTSIFAQTNNYKQEFILHNIRTANLVLEAKVIQKVISVDVHHSECATTTLLVNDVIEGKTEDRTIKLDYYLDRIDDKSFTMPKFEDGKNYILILYKGNGNKYELLGAELRKYCR